MAFEKAKEKYKKLKNEYDKRKNSYETQRKSWAESKAVKLETQAKKDQELLNVYKRQDKAMKQSEELKAFQNKTKRFYEWFRGFYGRIRWKQFNVWF